MKAKIIFNAIAVICMVVAIVGYVYAVNSTVSNEIKAQQYCNEFNMELQYYNVDEPTIICVSDSARLTTVWRTE